MLHWILGFLQTATSPTPSSDTGYRSGEAAGNTILSAVSSYRFSSVPRFATGFSLVERLLIVSRSRAGQEIWK
ncbi:hypothetical protein TB2_021333 [Malus domestica]